MEIKRNYEVTGLKQSEGSAFPLYVLMNFGSNSYQLLQMPNFFSIQKVIVQIHKSKTYKGYSTQSYNHPFRSLIPKKSHYMHAVFFLVPFFTHLSSYWFYAAQLFLLCSFLKFFDNQTLFLSYILHKYSEKMKVLKKLWKINE